LLIGWFIIYCFIFLCTHGVLYKVKQLSSVFLNMVLFRIMVCWFCDCAYYTCSEHFRSLFSYISFIRFSLYLPLALLQLPVTFITFDNKTYVQKENLFLEFKVITLFIQYISYVVAVSLIGGGNRRKPPICRKSLDNFIT
jgi:hypothetical protein